MQIALKEAKKSLKKGEVPVGAIIIKNNKIIAKAHNLKEKKHNVIKHAEINVIEKACKKLKNWRLENCILYVTMEPCIMCSGAIIYSRIKKIVYGANNENYGATKILKKEFDKNKIEIIPNINEKESIKLLQDFFKKRR